MPELKLPFFPFVYSFNRGISQDSAQEQNIKLYQLDVFVKRIQNFKNISDLVN